MKFTTQKGLVLGILVLSWLPLASLFAQGLNDFLDLSGGGSAAETVEAIVPENSEATRQSTGGWVDWMTGHNLFADQGVAALTWWDISNDWTMWNEIRKVKAEIAKLGVQVGEGGVSSHVNSQHYEKSQWTLAELLVIRDTLKVLPPSFRSETKALYRATGDPNSPTVVGRVWPNKPDHVFLFNGCTGQNEMDGNYFSAVLVHEMAHCYYTQWEIHSTVWEEHFWTSFGGGARNVIGFHEGEQAGWINGSYGVAGANFAKGAPITSYGTENEREDFAECASAFYLSPGALTKHPERQTKLAGMLEPPLSAPVGEISGYGYGGFAPKEGYPYTYHADGRWARMSGPGNEDTLNAMASSLGIAMAKIVDKPEEESEAARE
jgi:hypothetical protein